MNFLKALLLAFLLFFADDSCGTDKSKIVELQNKVENCTNDTVKVELLNQLANVYYEVENNFSHSYEYALQAKVLAEKIFDDKGIAEACYRMGRIHLAKNNFDQSILFLKKAAAHSKVSGSRHFEALSYNSIALLYKNWHHYELAKIYYDSAMASCHQTGDRKTLSTIYTNLGRLAHVEGDLTSEENYSQKALEIGLDLNDSEILVEAYMDIGTRLCYQQSNDLGIKYLEKAANLIRKEKGEVNSMLGFVYGTIGFRLAYARNHEKSKHYLELALRNISENFGSRSPQVGLIHSYFGDLYFLMNSPDSSLLHYTLSLNILKKTLPESSDLIRKIHSYIGASYMSKNELEKAFYYLKKNLEQSDKRDIYLSVTYLRLGQLALIQEDPRKSLEHLQSCINLNAFDFKNSNYLTNPSVSSHFFSDQIFLKAVQQKAVAFVKLYHLEDSLINLKRALDNFSLCDEIITETKSSNLSDSDILFFSNEVNEVYQQAFQTSFILFEQTNNPEYFKQAFYFAEKNKANLLHQKHSKIPEHQLPPHLRKYFQQEKTLNNKLAVAKSQLNISYRRNDSAKIVIWHDQILDLKQEIKDLNHASPEIASFKNDTKVIDPQDLIRCLNDDEVLIEYMICDTACYAIILSQKGQDLVKLPSFDLEQSLERLNSAIFKQQKKPFVEMSYLLYGHLIHPFHKRIEDFNRLVIVPDGPLWHLNFDLLLSDNNPQLNYKSLRYLLKNFSVSYQYSSSVLATEHKRKRNPPIHKKVLAFSFNDLETDLEFFNFHQLRNRRENIPGTSQEIKAIAEIFDGEYYFGKSANEENFKKNAPNYSLLHLALHGELDDTSPENSRLLFDTHNTDDDGNLHVFEIYNLALNADLAVLSACHSGSGKVFNGEGKISLGRAFTYAGVNSLILSMWEVSDATAPYLMKLFYSHLQKGLPKDKALRRAKLEFLESSDELIAAPFFWGNLYLLGNRSKVQIDQTDSFYHVMACSFAILSLSVLFFVYFKKVFNNRKTRC